MEIWEKVNAAGRMQDYIHHHLDENIILDEICKAANYSKWHSLRIFKEIFHKTPFEYIRAVRMTSAAHDIKHDSDNNIVDIALNTGFSSHEGFTKAFRSYFGVNPSKYRDGLPRRYLYFEPTSILEYYLRLNSKEHIEMSENQRTVTVTTVKKPACKLILARGIKATHYFELCEEIGCDKSEMLEAISEKLTGIPYNEQSKNHIFPSKSASNIGRTSYI
ncbi:MAG: helix-turn-helix transcriptional regulator [Oscillospiraceae bacterium]|jgi:AraC-like DNA-binding protein|nr:helix-turn-helix transcriptional regulator [Oscillospiraceae bacterium]